MAYYWADGTTEISNLWNEFKSQLSKNFTSANETIEQHTTDIENCVTKKEFATVDVFRHKLSELHTDDAIYDWFFTNTGTNSRKTITDDGRVFVWDNTEYILREIVPQSGDIIEYSVGSDCGVYVGTYVGEDDDNSIYSYFYQVGTSSSSPFTARRINHSEGTETECTIKRSSGYYAGLNFATVVGSKLYLGVAISVNSSSASYYSWDGGTSSGYSSLTSGSDIIIEDGFYSDMDWYSCNYVTNIATIKENEVTFAGPYKFQVNDSVLEISRILENDNVYTCGFIENYIAFKVDRRDIETIVLYDFDNDDFDIAPFSNSIPNGGTITFYLNRLVFADGMCFMPWFQYADGVSYSSYGVVLKALY